MLITLKSEQSEMTGFAYIILRIFFYKVFQAAWFKVISKIFSHNLDFKENYNGHAEVENLFHSSF